MRTDNRAAGNGHCNHRDIHLRPDLTFDVASVREAPVADSYAVTGNLAIHSGSMRLQNMTLQNLLIVAFGIERYQMDGLPDWDYPAMFTIDARSDSATDARLAGLGDDDAQLEKQHMLQILLADRFQMKTHWETRQLPAYDLVPSRDACKQALARCRAQPTSKNLAAAQASRFISATMAKAMISSATEPRWQAS